MPVLERLEDGLHPLSSFVIVPLFALANAGVTLGGDARVDRVAAERDAGVGQREDRHDHEARQRVQRVLEPFEHRARRDAGARA